MKEQRTPTRQISRRDVLRLGANTALGLMAFESSFLITGKRGFIDFFKASPHREQAEDEFEQYMQVIAPLKQPFEFSSYDDLERRRTGWIWYSVGLLGQLLTVIDKLDEVEDGPN